MAFQMRVAKDVIEGKDVVPPGIYEVKLVGFNPKVSKSGTSVNLNAIMQITNHAEFGDRKIYDTMNSNGYTYADFSHCFGLPMETDGTEFWLPGTWDKDKAKYNADDPATWIYNGPLVGRTGKVEIAVDNYNGKDNNKVKRYFCAIADCEKKFPGVSHREDLLRKSN